MWECLSRENEAPPELHLNRVQSGGTGLLNFLLQFVKFRRGEELAQGDAKTVADQLNGQKLWVFALSVEDVFEAGRGRAHMAARRLMLRFRSPQSCGIRFFTADMVSISFRQKAFSF